jgi:replicative DNA helicase
MTDDRLSGALQENLLTLLCFDDAHCKIARAALTPQLFESSVFREIAGIAISFIDQYGETVKEHLPDHLEHILNGEDARKAASYKRLVDNLFLSKDSINSEYVLSQLNKFVRAQTLKSGLVQAVEAMEDNNIEAAETHLQKALSKQIVAFEGGLNFANPEHLKRLMEGGLSEPGFDLGVPELDRLGIIPRRKELFMLIAGRGKGKSWFLLHCAKMALLQRWSVLIITLEMSETNYGARAIQSFYAVRKDAGEVRLAQLIKSKSGSLEDVLYEQVERMSLSNDKDKGQITAKAVKDFGRRKPLRVKGFPSGQATIKDIEAYLDQLERFEGFVPDALMLDYPDLCKHDPKNKRIELGQILVDFRGLGNARNMATIAVSQPNRDGEAATTITGDMVSEDISKMATVDTCLTMSSTKIEESLGLARLLVEKARNQRDGFSMLITQAYSIGQWCLDSVLLHPGDYWEMLKEKEKSGERKRHYIQEGTEDKSERRRSIRK